MEKHVLTGEDCEQEAHEYMTTIGTDKDESSLR
jgi:hypothetical protein